MASIPSYRSKRVFPAGPKSKSLNWTPQKYKKGCNVRFFTSGSTFLPSFPLFPSPTSQNCLTNIPPRLLQALNSVSISKNSSFLLPRIRSTLFSVSQRCPSHACLCHLTAASSRAMWTRLPKKSQKTETKTCPRCQTHKLQNLLCLPSLLLKLI